MKWHINPQSRCFHSTSDNLVLEEDPLLPKDGVQHPRTPALSDDDMPISSPDVKSPYPENPQ